MELREVRLDGKRGLYDLLDVPAVGERFAQLGLGDAPRAHGAGHTIREAQQVHYAAIDDGRRQALDVARPEYVVEGVEDAAVDHAY